MKWILQLHLDIDDWGESQLWNDFKMSSEPSTSTNQIIRSYFELKQMNLNECYTQQEDKAVAIVNILSAILNKEWSFLAHI